MRQVWRWLQTPNLIWWMYGIGVAFLLLIAIVKTLIVKKTTVVKLTQHIELQENISFGRLAV
jgi:hypothetical protein